MRGVRLWHLMVLVAASGAGSGWAHADADALWTIVHDQCVPHEQRNGDPAPCALVDLSGPVPDFTASPSVR